MSRTPCSESTRSAASSTRSFTNEQTTGAPAAGGAVSAVSRGSRKWISWPCFQFARSNGFRSKRCVPKKAILTGGEDCERCARSQIEVEGVREAEAEEDEHVS